MEFTTSTPHPKVYTSCRQNMEGNSVFKNGSFFLLLSQLLFKKTQACLKITVSRKIWEEKAKPNPEAYVSLCSRNFHRW